MNAPYLHQRLASAALLALSLALSPASATVISYSGNTMDALKFQRPVEDLSALSVIGTAAHYDAFSFVAASTAAYRFTTSGVFDTFVVLYGGLFSPLAPLSQALVANDDASSTAFNVSEFNWNLTAGRGYTYVVTGFDNDEYGSFKTTIQSLAAPVPEPGIWPLILVGLGVMALLKPASFRRRLANRRTA